jgi:hypothetical protein
LLLVLVRAREHRAPARECGGIYENMLDGMFVNPIKVLNP